MAIIKKKCWPEYFLAIQAGQKKYDLRLNDMSIKVGDTLVQEEWDPLSQIYTGRKIEQKVTYVREIHLDKLPWPKEEINKKGLVIMSLE